MKKKASEREREGVVMEASAAGVPASSPSPSALRLLRSGGDGSGDVARDRGAASFSTQANALLRKNLTYQVSSL